MSDAFVINSAIDRTLFEGLVAAYRDRATRRPALAGPAHRRSLLSEADRRSASPGAQDHAAHANRRERRRALAELNAVAVAFFALQTSGRTPAMLNFSARSRQCLGRLQGGLGQDDPDVARLRRQGPPCPLVGGLSQSARIIYLEDIRAGVRFLDKARALLDGKRPLVTRGVDDPAVILFTSGSERARPRASSCRIATFWPTPRRRWRASTSTRTTRCSTCCRSSTPSA